MKSSLLCTVSDDGFKSCCKVMISENGGFPILLFLAARSAFFMRRAEKTEARVCFFQKIPSDLLTAQ